MTKIIHISDTHFGTEIPAVVSAIKKTIQNIQPDIILLTGDVTQRATQSQFKGAADFMDSLTAKVKLVIPGNHDIPLHNIFSRLFTPYRNYMRYFGVKENIYCSKDLGIIGYDATDIFRHTRGKLNGSTLIDKIKQARKSLNSDAILIACAHQPLVTAWPQDSHEVLIHAQKTAELFSEHKIDMVLSGHVHVPLITTTIQAFPKLKNHFMLVGAGTAISHRTRPDAPNSFNLIDVSSDKNSAVKVTQFYFDDISQQFISSPDDTVNFVNQQNGWNVLI